MIADSADTAPVVEERTTIYEGAVFSFVTDKVRLGNEEVVRRDYIDHPGAVAVVAASDDPDPAILLIRQYRHPVGQRMWEIPAGLTDQAGEDRLEAAKRELAEETGYAAATWSHLLDVCTSPGASSERLRIYLAQDLTPTQAPEGFEREGEEADMEVRFVALSEIERAIGEGRLHSPSLIMGVLAYARARSTGGPADRDRTETQGAFDHNGEKA
ncbi:MAG: NUDIX hydrolase [Actinomycetaceae bacterium]|nr:NUDIX hydrolase [Actinomycetaceae bacterium]